MHRAARFARVTVPARHAHSCRHGSSRSRSHYRSRLHPRQAHVRRSDTHR